MTEDKILATKKIGSWTVEVNQDPTEPIKRAFSVIACNGDDTWGWLAIPESDAFAIYKDIKTVKNIKRDLEYLD